MTIGLGARYGRGRNRAAAATLVFDQDIAELVLDLLGPQPRNDIDHAARRARHHELDRLIGKFRLREGGKRRSCGNRQRSQARGQHVTSTHGSDLIRLAKPAQQA
jgi:hypothetical protein